MTLVLLLSGCVGERSPDADGDGDGSGSDMIEPGWVATTSVTKLAADDTYLYFADNGGTRLERVALSGGTPELLVDLGPSNGWGPGIASITLGATDVVFVVTETDLQTSYTTRTLRALSKQGGAIRDLATSKDSRAFLGVTIADTTVYYSSFTAVLKVPLAGGTPQLVGQSPDSTRYWIYTPVVLGDNIYWTELGRVFRMAKTDAKHEGTPIASLPGSARIIGVGDKLVVGLSTAPGSGFGYGDPLDSMIDVDPATGATGTMVSLGLEAFGATLQGTDVWATAPEGLVRVDRTTGAQTALSSAPGFDVAATGDSVYVATETGITRVAQ